MRLKHLVVAVQMALAQLGDEVVRERSKKRATT